MSKRKTMTVCGLRFVWNEDLKFWYGASGEFCLTLHERDSGKWAANCEGLEIWGDEKRTAEDALQSTLTRVHRALKRELAPLGYEVTP